MGEKRRQSPLQLEHDLYRRGFLQIVGVDEVGRGCLAGPVFAAAVILPPGLLIPGVDDSKKLTPRTREGLFPKITAVALDWTVASVGPEEIDEINIHNASLKAMLSAVLSLKRQPDFLLVDGRFPLGTSIPQKAVVHGDSLSQSVAAASILAKVLRDRWMVSVHREYPEFGFDCHKGYGTKRHFEAIRRFGTTPLHRRSFTSS